MACAATAKAGPSPAPRMIRHIMSVVSPTVPIIGNCASAQITASTSSTQRVCTRLTMNPTTIAAIENRRKKEEPSSPNSFGSSLSSVMIGTAARPTTILSAKFTSMNRNSRNVMVQAPFGVCDDACASVCVDVSLDIAGAAISLPRLWSVGPVVRALHDATHGFPGMAIGHFDSSGDATGATQLRNTA